MKKITEETICGVSAFLLAVILILVAIFHTPLSHENPWGLPSSHEMAKTAMDKQIESSSFKTLKNEVNELIPAMAAKGIRSTELYVGAYDKDAVLEMIRELAFSNYKVELVTRFKKDDFMVISW